MRAATWLGWQIDSNWASPWLFAVYAIIKPLAGSMLLVCMYWAARSANGGVGAPGYLPFLYVSSACYMVIGGITLGMTNAVISDRESYATLKFIRISPVSLQIYLFGRGFSKAAQAALGAALTIALGLLLFPELREALSGRNLAWGWLALYLTLGSLMLVDLGLILAGAVLNMARYGMFLSEGVAGVLFLLSGAVFPLDLLPTWLRPVSLALPPTYWLEAMRRALLGPTSLRSPLSAWDHSHLALALAGTTVVLTILGQCFFRWSERRAWRLGRYEEISGN